MRLPSFHPVAQARKKSLGITSTSPLTPPPLESPSPVDLTHPLSHRSLQLRLSGSPTDSGSYLLPLLVSPAPVFPVHRCLAEVISPCAISSFHGPHFTALLKSIQRLLSYRRKPKFLRTFWILQTWPLPVCPTSSPAIPPPAFMLQPFRKTWISWKYHSLYTCYSLCLSTLSKSDELLFIPQDPVQKFSLSSSPS